MNAAMNHQPAFAYPEYERGESVALFVPCYVDQFYPRIAEATARLLTRLGVRVVFPPKQTCCGQPAFNSGYWAEARQVVRHFARVFTPYSYIVCPSGSCAAMCRVFFPFVDPAEDVVGVGRRVFEFTEFLVEVLRRPDVGASFPHKVTLHIGCHTRRELGVVRPPELILEHIEKLEYVPLAENDECCGFGGTFSVKMPGTSLAMGRSKVDHIVATGASWVLTTDISCLMHVGGITRRDPRASGIHMAHIAEVLANYRELSG